MYDPDVASERQPNERGETTMSKATRILKAVAKMDSTTRKGRAVIRLHRGKYERLFRTCSQDLRDSVMRTFDRIAYKLPHAFNG
jgi:hypothetical protein